MRGSAQLLSCFTFSFRLILAWVALWCVSVVAASTINLLISPTFLTFSPSSFCETSPIYRNSFPAYYDLCWLLMIPPVILCSNTRFRFGTRSYLHRIIIRSLRVSIGAFSPCRLYIYVSLFCAVSGFCLFCSITLNDPPDIVSVRRRRLLPPASFRFHLAVDTLAIG